MTRAYRGAGLYGGNLHAYVLRRPQAELVGIEVTQALQDWQASIPLIAGKRTYVRAHVQALEKSPPPVQARLHAYLESGAELPGSPLRPINPAASCNLPRTPP